MSRRLKFHATSACLSLCLFASACASHGATVVASPQRPQSTAAASLGPRPNVAQYIYLASRYNAQINVYRVGEPGNTAPIAVIAGPHTGLKLPINVALDSAGEIFVRQSDGVNSYQVLVFAPGSVGDVSPLRVIAGSNTSLIFSQGMAVDPPGSVYVTTIPDTVDVFSPGATGNVAPNFTISGSMTKLDTPTAAAFDVKQRLWVANAHSITMYPAGAAGNSPPLKKIKGSNTGLDMTTNGNGIAFESTGDVYVFNGGKLAFDEFAKTAHGNVAPVAVISGPLTHITVSDSEGIALDGASQIYVTSAGGGLDEIDIYAPGANGNDA